MKNIARILVLLLLVILPVGVFAQQHAQNTVLSKDQTVNGTYFGTGREVRVEGTVNGDAYVAGGTVTINGRINGDLLVAGGTVTVNGTVTQDIRAGGGTVTIAGDVGRNVSVGGGTVTVSKDATISGTLVAGAGTLAVAGPVKDDIYAGGGTISIDNSVGGNAFIDAGNLTIGSSAKVAGNVSYTSTNEALVEKGASVSGQLEQHAPTRAAAQPEQTQQQVRKSFISAFVWGKIISLAALYLFGLLFIHFLPRFTEGVVTIVQRDVWKSIGVGILVLLVTPLVAIFLMVTLVGIPFAFLLLFGYIALLYLGKLFVALFLGQWAAGAFKRKVSMAWALFIGLILHLMITLVPVLGWIAGVFMMLWGVGAILLGKNQAYRTLRKKDLL